MLLKLCFSVLLEKGFKDSNNVVGLAEVRLASISLSAGTKFLYHIVNKTVPNKTRCLICRHLTLPLNLVQNVAKDSFRTDVSKLNSLS